MILNEENPLVSIIVTTYNRRGLLNETINSILNQTYKNFELIIVDNFSNYDFFKHIKTFNDLRIRGFQNQNNGIIAVNRNFGIKKTKGEYIAFCDDDDLWHPNKLTCQLKELEKCSCGLCFTNIDYINSDGGKINIKHKIKRQYRNLTFNKYILSGSSICNSSIMIKRDVVKTVGLISEDPQLIAAEDYDYWARILKKYKSCYVDKVLVSYRINNVNSVQNTINTHWLRKELYLLNSINSMIKINKLLYIIKLIKILFIYLYRNSINR